LKRSPKIRLKICSAVLMFAALFAPVSRLHAQTTGLDKTSKAEKVDAPETNKELEAFRHAPAVQSLADRFHVSVEFMAKLLEDLNSAILIAAILWFVFRMVPKMYRRRTETLQKQLFDARLATSEANEKLAAIDERLSKLGIEIDAIRQQTERDSATDEKRIHETLEAEKQRLVSSVEHEIEAAGATARRDLKNYAATLAVERAMAELRLTDEDDRMLVRSFGKDLSGERN
jgi:F-type H+-transporting ATPase subunit b